MSELNFGGRPARRIRLSGLVALLGLYSIGIHAATVRVGPSAGEPDSACEFATMAEAVESLPADGAPHRVEVEVATYLDDRIVMSGPLRHAHVIGAFAINSGCSIPFPPGGINRPKLLGLSFSTGRGIALENGAELVLENIDVEGFPAGAAIVRDAKLWMIRSRLTGNRTTGNDSGGAVVVEGGVLRAEDASFSSNHAGANGGAIFCSRSPVNGRSTVDIFGNSSFTSNEARNGGAIYLHEACDLMLRDTAKFILNEAALDGGAIAAQAQQDADATRNTVLLMGDTRFDSNSALGDGGAISLHAAARLRSIVDGAATVFENNRSGGEGGAVSIQGVGPFVLFMNARFEGNTAGSRGGALALRNRHAVLAVDCASSELAADRYCGEFRRNTLTNINAQETQRGGTLHVSDGGSLRVERYAFIESGLSGAMDRVRGAVAWVQGGVLQLASSLVVQSSPEAGSAAPLFEFAEDGQGLLFFSTFADNPAGAVVYAGAGSQVSMIGNIVSGNAAGIDGPGDISGTCNNAQLGAEPEPFSPGFVRTPRGDFRLAIDSAMIDFGLNCREDQLPPDFTPPRLDLDGRLRARPGELPMSIDAGAFEFVPDDEAIFASGFES